MTETTELIDKAEVLHSWAQDAQAENDRLRAELETERMRLAACGVVALADTPESAAKARQMAPEYRSASLDDVERRVDECIRLRDENRKLRTVMVAAAEEIAAHWPAHCDADGYGPQNLLRRLEEGIPSEYGYTAGAFEALRAEVSALRPDALRYRWVRSNCECMGWGSRSDAAIDRHMTQRADGGGVMGTSNDQQKGPK